MTTALHLGTPVPRIRALRKICDSGESVEAVARRVTRRDGTDPVVGRLIGLAGQTGVLAGEMVVAALGALP